MVSARRIPFLKVGGRFRSPTKGNPLPVPDPELKATLDEMNRRYRVQRERAAAGDDTPDAA
jgi:hypothetical protein